VSTPKTRAIPPHVPAHLVVDFDFFEVQPGLRDPFDKWQALIDAGAPPIFWSPNNGGHWTFLKYDDIREAYRNHESFSNRHQSIPKTQGWPILQPNGVDPPEHSKFRNLLMPLFTPAAVASLQGEVRRRTRTLLDAFVDDGQCDFVAQFSGKLPTGMFIYLMGMDEGRLEEFIALADFFMRVEDPVAKARNVREIYGLLEEFFRGKQKNPGDDIASLLIRARDAAGSGISHEEVINCAFLLFVAGLDTVTSTMNCIWRYLAASADARHEISGYLPHPDKLNRAIEELLRFYAVSNIYRRVTKDMTYKGVTLKAHEMVVLPDNLANRDPAIFERPRDIDLTRKVNPHLTFGLGVHRCIGSHLAKLEVSTALQEWLPRIPNFRMAAELPLKIFAGPVMGCRSLPLAWDMRIVEQDAD
jgi:cytochrome P450